MFTKTYEHRNTLIFMNTLSSSLGGLFRCRQVDKYDGQFIYAGNKAAYGIFKNMYKHIINILVVLSFIVEYFVLRLP